MLRIIGKTLDYLTAGVFLIVGGTALCVGIVVATIVAWLMRLALGAAWLCMIVSGIIWLHTRSHGSAMFCAKSFAVAVVVLLLFFLTSYAGRVFAAWDDRRSARNQMRVQMQPKAIWYDRRQTV